MERGTRVGHAGTLDPFATGLLLVLVGRLTRAQRFFVALPKTYRAVARLGWRSDTGDRDGRLEQTGRVPADLVLPTGELMQRPHPYSAVKVAGERAYKRARRGEEVETTARPVTVYRFEQLWREGERAGLEVECSAGTYVRSLVSDLGDAYCDELERVAIGPFKLDRAGLEVECSAGTYVRSLVSDLGDAYCDELERVAIGPFKLDRADPERLVPVEEALAFLPAHELGPEAAEGVGYGRRVPAGGGGEPFVRLCHEGEVLAIGELRDDELQPVVVFRPR